MQSAEAPDEPLSESLNAVSIGGREVLSRQTVAGFDTFIARDRDSAQEKATRVLSPHRLTLQDPRSDMEAVFRIGPYGAVSIYMVQFGADVTIDRPAQSNYMCVMIPCRGRLDGRHQRQDFYAPSGTSTVVLSEGDPVHMRWDRQAAVIALRAELEPLTERLVMLAPETRVRSPLRFDPLVSSGPVHQILVGTMQLLAQSAATGAGSGPSRVALRLAGNALDTLLLALPHNYSAALNESTPPISRRAVKTVVDHIANEREPEYAVGDLAKLAGVSLRTLEAGFRAELDCTPLQYLRRSRLSKAHAELAALDGASGVTVGKVAARWGFFHMGRFAAAFREQFGMSPSEVLRAN
ncbi:AraC family transcriptional regulator [Mycobacterium sp. 21AC1]|uniref:AraC family transcriptional regulator n=1 Tax=[Mycobacterium] appelbergii TaxID=2939269 RepID=UPI00293931C6|nr:AraC family transcriptional regulator [Mycobacterium sp. 21AC1]MDV3129941.1 AraC family transcriptional regulator [Mycobacterium sp. 21AC1]